MSSRRVELELNASRQPSSPNYFGCKCNARASREQYISSRRRWAHLSALASHPSTAFLQWAQTGQNCRKSFDQENLGRHLPLLQSCISHRNRSTRPLQLSPYPCLSVGSAARVWRQRTRGNYEFDSQLSLARALLGTATAAEMRAARTGTTKGVATQDTFMAMKKCRRGICRSCEDSSCQRKFLDLDEELFVILLEIATRTFFSSFVALLAWSENPMSSGTWTVDHMKVLLAGGPRHVLGCPNQSLTSQLFHVSRQHNVPCTLHSLFQSDRNVSTFSHYQTTQCTMTLCIVQLFHMNRLRSNNAARQTWIKFNSDGAALAQRGARAQRVFFE